MKDEWETACKLVAKGLCWSHLRLHWRYEKKGSSCFPKLSSQGFWESKLRARESQEEVKVELEIERGAIISPVSQSALVKLRAESTTSSLGGSMFWNMAHVYTALLLLLLLLFLSFFWASGLLRWEPLHTCSLLSSSSKNATNIHTYWHPTSKQDHFLKRPVARNLKCCIYVAYQTISKVQGGCQLSSRLIHLSRGFA